MVKNILGVRIDDVSKEEALGIVVDWLSGHPGARRAIGSKKMLSLRSSMTSKLIFTPGPEFLVTARKDLEFRKILNSSDLNIPDGYGLKIFGGIMNLTPGVDFMKALCQKAVEKNWTIGLLGGQNGVAEKTAEVLRGMYQKIQISFALDGKEADKIISKPDTLRYSDILFVALGHPRQEKFLYRFRVKPGMTKFKIGMGVGGSFDFISGEVPEPPEIFSRLGLKWLGRFVIRPKYMLPKIYKAVILYPWLSLSQIFKRTVG